MHTDFSLETSAGTVTGIDFGGQGTEVVLIHEAAMNAAALIPLGERLATFCHPIALDLRGHGLHPGTLTHRNQVWDDLAPIVAALGTAHPVVVAFGSSAIAAAIAVERHVIAPGGLVLVGSLTPYDEATSRETLAEVSDPDVGAFLAERFGLDATGPVEDRAAYVDSLVREAGSDWLLGDVDPDVMRAIYERSVPRRGEQWVRTPSRESFMSFFDITATSPVPTADTYHGFTFPTMLVSHADMVRESDIEELDLIAGHIGGGHRILPGRGMAHLTGPDEVAAIVADVVRQVEDRSSLTGSRVA